MTDSFGCREERSVLTLVGLNGKTYEFVFFYNFQEQTALKIISEGEGLDMIDPTSVITQESKSI
tara:strand:+ start:290 stop:481 length:192 start_codon:yes stop_codon:yes gene_type:complete